MSMFRRVLVNPFHGLRNTTEHPAVSKLSENKRREMLSEIRRFPKYRHTRVIYFNYLDIQDNPVLLRLTWFASSSVSLLTNLLSFDHRIVLYFLVSGSETQHWSRSTGSKHAWAFIQKEGRECRCPKTA